MSADLNPTRVGPERRSANPADVAGTADLTYSQNEVDMINDLRDRVNDVLAALRKAGFFQT